MTWLTALAANSYKISSMANLPGNSAKIKQTHNNCGKNLTLIHSQQQKIHQRIQNGTVNAKNDLHDLRLVKQRLHILYAKRYISKIKILYMK